MSPQEQKMTKKERRALKKQQKQAKTNQSNNKQQSKKIGGYLLGAVVLIIAIAGVWNMASSGGGSHQAEDYTVITDKDHTKGSDNPVATLIEYSDFQCPACASYYQTVKELGEEFGDNLQIVYRHFPLTQLHEHALPAARAAEAAGMQGKFWEMHDKLFEEMNTWSRQNDPKLLFESYASDLGLDVEKFRRDSDSRAAREKINTDTASGRALFVSSTPTFILNGKKIENPRNPDEFRKLIQDIIDNPANVKNYEAEEPEIIELDSSDINEDGSVDLNKVLEKQE